MARTNALKQAQELSRFTISRPVLGLALTVTFHKIFVTVFCGNRTLCIPNVTVWYVILRSWNKTAC